MAELTLDQQKAIAMASARMRAAEAESAPQQTPAQSRIDSGIQLYKDAGRAALELGAGGLRGAKDVIDTGADWLSNLGGAEENARVKAMNKQGKADYDTRYGNSKNAKVGRLGGQIGATLPVGGALAKIPQALSKLPMLASQAPKLNAAATALRTAGFRTGLPASTTFAGKAGQMALRSGAGAAVGGASAGLVNPQEAGKGALIGGMLPPGLKLAGFLGEGAKNVTSAAVKHGLGVSTGTGAESIGAAYNAGKNKSTSFLDNMRGNVSFNDVVDEAKGALQNMRADRSQAYRSGMVDISNDKAVVDFKPIADAVSRVSQMGSYKGQQINKNAAGTVNDLTETVNNWASLNPAEYHTPEGLDALKQAIGDIRDTTQFGTAARRSADTVYNAVKDQITAQAPTYAKVMKDYSEASTVLQETEKALSLGNKTAQDTAIRKLQSLMRNNAQTNYGNRLDIAKNLENKGGVNLLPAIAGQSMSSAMPRGLSGAITKSGAVLGAAGSGGASIPLTLAAAPFTSPRIMGEALYGAGRMRSLLPDAMAGLTQEQIAALRPGLLNSQLYRAAPVIATSKDLKIQR